MFELNLPNVLTVFRIPLVPVLVAALLSGASSDALAAGVFILARITDALDGWLARAAQVGVELRPADGPLGSTACRRGWRW